MKYFLLCLWTWVLLVLIGNGRSMGCLEEERNALLKIKATFNHPNGSSLPSWGDDDGDYCSWEGIECDNTTSRVTQLVLSYIRDFELREYGPWVIDASLFLPLEELQVLDLRNNCLSDLNGTLHLKKLNRLDLSFNNLERVPSLYKKTSTEAQQLSSNQPKGVNLEVLDLGKNNLANDALTDIMRITSLKALYINQCGLNASSKFLEGSIPETFSNLKSVESLDLSYNNLIGQIPPQLTELYTLSNFRVAYNKLSGRTPDRKNQFGTFGETSYEGNPLLCGTTLRSCDNSNRERETLPSFNHTMKDDPWREAFLWSFAGSYVVAFLGMVLFLYLNSYHQYVLFELVCKLIPSFPH